MTPTPRGNKALKKRVVNYYDPLKKTLFVEGVALGGEGVPIVPIIIPTTMTG